MSDPGQPPEGGWPPIRPHADDEPSTGPPNPWDPPATPEGATPSPPQVQVPPPASVPPPGYVPPAGQLSSGSGSGGTGAKRIRPASTGRRAPSMAIVGGFGLLGLLLTIAILALLANRVLSGTDDAADVLTGSLPPELTTTTVPGATTAPGGEGEGGGLPAIADPAQIATCQVNRSTLDVASQAYEITTGAPPADQQALVDEGLLAEPIPTHELAAGPSGVQITGVGECAGV